MFEKNKMGLIDRNRTEKLFETRGAQNPQELDALNEKVATELAGLEDDEGAAERKKRNALQNSHDKRRSELRNGSPSKEKDKPTEALSPKANKHSKTRSMCNDSKNGPQKLLARRDEPAVESFKFGVKPLFSPGRFNADPFAAAGPRGPKLVRKHLPEPTGAKLALEKIKNNLQKIEKKKTVALQNLGLQSWVPDALK